MYEREINRLPVTCPQMGAWPQCNPGMCPDWELNLRTFGPQVGAESTEQVVSSLSRKEKHWLL